jgi:hypothetical protein
MKSTEFSNTNDSQYKPHVYLDMDGVQCDFFKAWSKFEDVDNYKQIPKPEESIKRLASQGPEFVYRFFRDLEPLRGGLSVIEWLREHKIPYTILSSPLRYETQASIMGKQEWLDKHHLGASESAIYASDKSKYAVDSQGRPNVLIDDFGKNIIPWRNKGGIGIHHEPYDAQPTIDALEKIYFGSDDNENDSQLKEASPNTLEGSFTDDLKLSKVWLLHTVEDILDDAKIDHLNTIYVLGSWYSNVSMFILASNISFNKLINVDIDKKVLDVGAGIIDKLGASDKIEHMNKDANTLDYRQLKAPSLVINTSANDIEGTGWLENIPEGTLVAIQSRRGTLESFDKLYPLSRTFFLNKMELDDPEEKYTRFMKIGVR